MRIEDLEAQARSLLRLVGPRVSAMQDEQINLLRRCRICAPEPKVYQCYICGFAVEERWRYDVHIRIDPETCQRYAKRWAAKFSENV